MTNFVKLPTWADKQHVYAVVETPRGSRAKLEFDPKLGAFTLAKPLLAGLTYPYDWGFIPSTKAQDGDPLDVLIIRGTRSRPIIEGQEGAQRSCVCRARSFALRRRPAGHTAAAGESDRGAGEILRGDQRARIEEIAVSGLARTGQGHQNDKESRSLGRPTDSSPWGVCLVVQDHVRPSFADDHARERSRPRSTLTRIGIKVIFHSPKSGFSIRSLQRCRRTRAGTA